MFLQLIKSCGRYLCLKKMWYVYYSVPNLSRFVVWHGGREQKRGWFCMRGRGVYAHAHLHLCEDVGLQAPVPTARASGAANAGTCRSCEWSCMHQPAVHMARL